MEEFNRDFFKKDPVFNELYQLIKQKHKVAEHTVKVLTQNKHIKDFCEESRHFAELSGKNPIYIHYDVSSWYKKPGGVQVRIESIGVYENFIEYQVAKAKIQEGYPLN